MSASGVESNENNKTGNGKEDIGDKIGGSLLSAGAAAVVAGAVLVLAKLTGERSVVIIVNNDTPNPLRKINDHHESGRFAALPKLEIPPFAVDIFGSQNRNIAEGTVGSVTYSGDGITLLVGWNNPRIGDNKSNHTLEGINKSRYLVVRQTGSGDSGAKISYAIGIHPDYLLRGSLAAQGFPDLTVGIRHVEGVLVGSFITPISVRKLVNF